MRPDRIIGRTLMTIGALGASFAFIQVLFQQDSSTLPFQLSLPVAFCAVVGGAMAVRVGRRMSAA